MKNKFQILKQTQRVLNIIIVAIILVAFTASVPLSGYFIPHSAISIFSCDINGDYSNDIIVAHVTNWGNTNPTISVLKNNGYGLFTLVDTSISFAGGGHGNIFATNINNDNCPDIVINHLDNSTGIIQNFVRILYNDGQGNFLTFNDFSINSINFYDAITSGDLLGNSHQDIVFVDSYPMKWAVMYNDGQGNLSTPVYYNLNYYPQDIATGDLDGDGRDDIAIAGYSEIYYSKSSGFQKQELNVDATRIDIVDMNNDGKKDIITMNVFIGTTISILENAGGQTFIEHPQTGSQYAFYNSTVCDLNNDSLPELLYVTSNLDGINICYNQGSFTLGTPVLITIPYTGSTSYNLNCSDFDNNGFNDIALIENGGGTGTPYPNLLLFFNDGQGNFGPNPLTLIHSSKSGDKFSLTSYPNPFHNRTTFEFSISEILFLKLSIFSVNGRFISQLLNNKLYPGHYTLSWNGNENTGSTCKPGIYNACFTINGQSNSVIKLIKY